MDRQQMKLGNLAENMHGMLKNLDFFSETNVHLRLYSKKRKDTNISYFYKKSLLIKMGKTNFPLSP